MKKIIAFIVAGVSVLCLLTGCLNRMPYIKMTDKEEKYIFTMNDVPGFELPPSYEQASPEVLYINKDDRIMYSYVEKANKGKDVSKDAQRYWLRTSIAKYKDPETTKTTYANFTEEYQKYVADKGGEYKKIEDTEKYGIDKGFTFRDKDNYIIGFMKSDMYYEVYFISDISNNFESIVPVMTQKMKVASDTLKFDTTKE